MASRSRSSLAGGSGLPTPGGMSSVGGASSRRKSGIPSPGASPTKSSKGPPVNDEIAIKMAELQAAIRSKDPASYQRASIASSSGRRSALSVEGAGEDDEEIEMLKPLSAQSPPEFTSPRPVRRMSSTISSSSTSASALRRPSHSALRSHGQQQQRDDEGGTPTSTPGPAASFVRPGSSLSSSNYMSAHAGLSENHFKSPMPNQDLPQTPAKRFSDNTMLAPSSMGMARTLSTVSSSSNFSTAPSSLHLNQYEAVSAAVSGPPRIGDRVKAAGMEGVLRYTGEVTGKPGIWAGIELVDEYVGKGKNNGSVQGRVYFECLPECGIFALLSKVEVVSRAPAVQTLISPSTSGPPRSRPGSSMSGTGSAAGPTPRKLPRPSGGTGVPSTVARRATSKATEDSQTAAARITAGSRASSYLNLTAKDLQERRAQGQLAHSPRKSGMLASSVASTSSNATSTGGPTPKALRTARPSFGTASGAPPSTRKSIGGPTAVISGSIRRPPSSMRTQTPDVPSVPPLPSSFPTNSAPSATPAKRYSGISRPTTPSASGRPSSRLSQVGSIQRSVSRASSRASYLSGPPSRLGYHDDDAAEELLHEPDATSLRNELDEAKGALAKATREAEQAKLELLELTSDFRDEQKKSKALQLEIDELRRKAADSRLDEASAVDERHAEKEKQEIAIAELRQALEEARKNIADVTFAKSELASDLAQGHELLARLQTEHDTANKEAKTLANQVDELQKAGRAMVDLYEDKFQNLEDEFQTTQEALQASEQHLREARQEIERQQVLLQKHDRDNGNDHSVEALLAASLSASRRGEQEESALAIENDSLRAELEHVRKRVSTLEEQMEEAKADFEHQLEKEQKRRQDSLDALEKLRADLKDHKDRADKAREGKEKSDSRAHELEEALAESRRTLESERAELEALRSDQHQNASQSKNEELTHLRSALTIAQHGQTESQKELKKLRADNEALQEELKLMEEIRDDIKTGGPSMPMEQSKMVETLQAQAAQIEQLQTELHRAQRRELPRISTEPTNTDSVPTPLQSSFSPSTRDQLLSPHNTPGSPNHSPSSASSSGRKKRDSNTSIHSNTSLSSMTSFNSNHRRGSLKDEGSMMKDEIEGLKILLKQAESDNAKLRGRYDATVTESARLKDAQRALESTVTNLVEQLEHAQKAMGDQRGPIVLPSLPEKTSSQELLESEVKELKEKMQHMQKEYEKDKRDLNSEVAQLELLVESKIFREGELESQLEDTQRALKEASKAIRTNGHALPQVNDQKGGHGSPRTSKATVKPVRSSMSSTVSTKVSEEPSGRRSASQYSEEDLDDGLCEICKENHAVENCPIFGGSASDANTGKSGHSNNGQAAHEAPYCDDCDEYGHDLANCPLADEVF